jgi:hypothetical protein
MHLIGALEIGYERGDCVGRIYQARLAIYRFADECPFILHDVAIGVRVIRSTAVQDHPGSDCDCLIGASIGDWALIGRATYLRCDLGCIGSPKGINVVPDLELYLVVPNLVRHKGSATLRRCFEDSHTARGKANEAPLVTDRIGLGIRRSVAVEKYTGDHFNLLVGTRVSNRTLIVSSLVGANVAGGSLRPGDAALILSRRGTGGGGIDSRTARK